MKITYKNFDIEKVDKNIQEYINKMIHHIEHNITGDELWRRIFNSPNGLLEVIVEEDYFNEDYTIYPKVREGTDDDFMSDCWIYVDEDTNEIKHQWGVLI
ncbi:hypothetical protein UT300012_31910 [Paraclostridium bifermentans]